MVVSLVQPCEVTQKATGGGQFDTELQMAMWFDDRVVLGVTHCMHLYTDRCIPESKRITFVIIFFIATSHCLRPSLCPLWIVDSVVHGAYHG